MTFYEDDNGNGNGNGNSMTTMHVISSLRYAAGGGLIKALLYS